MRLSPTKILALLFICGCGLPPALVPVPVLLPTTDFDTLFFGVDGQWTLSDTAGGQACLVIQDSHVSILDTRCGVAESGLVARITDAPPVTGGVSVIVLTATYNRHTFEDTRFRLTFSGQRQLDGSFTGIRRDEILDGSSDFEEIPAVLRRTALPQ